MHRCGISLFRDRLGLWLAFIIILMMASFIYIDNSVINISLYFVYFGGQIAVIIADFFQGIFAIIVLLVVVLYLFFTVSWDQVTDALEQTPIKLAKEEISDLETQETFKSLTEIEQENQIKQCFTWSLRTATIPEFIITGQLIQGQ